MKLWYGFLLFLLAACNAQPHQQLDKVEAEAHVFHPRIYWTESPSSHAILSWTSDIMGNANYVVYDTKPALDTSIYKYRVEANQNGQITYKPSDAYAGVPKSFFHHADVEQLEPNTTYYYRFCTDNTCSPEYNFKTAPSQSAHLTVLFGGDSRIGKEEGSDPAAHVDRRAANLLVKHLVEDDSAILALVHGADFGMNANWQYLYHWFNDHELTITDNKRVLPLIISRGNHDHEIGFTENFRLGKVTENNSDGYYYCTQLTDSIALLTLNTETSMAGYQKEWLEKTLAAKRPSSAWLFVQYHKPAYPAVKHFDREDFARVRQVWVPLFEKYAIDIALESDGHALKKTVPLLQNKPNPKGIIYIGEGGMGVPQRTPDPERWYFLNGGHASSNHHVWKLTFQPQVLSVKAFGFDKDTILSFELNRKNL